jgi:hypothetical protein
VFHDFSNILMNFATSRASDRDIFPASRLPGVVRSRDSIVNHSNSIFVSLQEFSDLEGDWLFSRQELRIETFPAVPNRPAATLKHEMCQREWFEWN